MGCALTCILGNTHRLSALSTAQHVPTHSLTQQHSTHNEAIGWIIGIAHLVRLRSLWISMLYLYEWQQMQLYQVSNVYFSFRHVASTEKIRSIDPTPVTCHKNISWSCSETVDLSPQMPFCVAIHLQKGKKLNTWPDHYSVLMYLVVAHVLIGTTRCRHLFVTTLTVRCNWISDF